MRVHARGAGALTERVLHACNEAASRSLGGSARPLHPVPIGAPSGLQFLPETLFLSALFLGEPIWPLGPRAAVGGRGAGAEGVWLAFLRTGETGSRARSLRPLQGTQPSSAGGAGFHGVSGLRGFEGLIPHAVRWAETATEAGAVSGRTGKGRPLPCFVALRKQLCVENPRCSWALQARAWLFVFVNKVLLAHGPAVVHVRTCTLVLHVLVDGSVAFYRASLLACV